MAYLFRLIALWCLLVGSAHAAFTAPLNYTWTRPAPGAGGAQTAYGSGPDKAAACTQAIAAYVIPYEAYWRANAVTNAAYWTPTAIVNNGTSCAFSTNAGQTTFTPGSAALCPVNSTGTSSCTCNTGYTQSGSSCVDNDTAACSSLAGQSAGMKNWEGKADSFSFCDSYASAGGTSVGGGKCIATALKDISWQSPPDSGHWISQGEAKYTGGKATTCTGTGGTGSDPAGSTPPGGDGTLPKEPANGQAAPSPCPAGQAPGEVNGTRVCAPVGPDVEAKDTKKEVNADGSIKNTTQDTKCKDGNCTTDTTTCTAASASATQTCSTTQATQGQAAFCNSNKGSKACTGDQDGTGGSFTGDCVAGFKAEGDDPVLNAMALDQHKRHCEMLRKDQPESLAYDALKDVAGTTKATTPGDSTVNVGPGNFDTSDALGGGGCSLNKTIVVAGRSATLPFNVICDPLAMLGQLLVAVSLLLAARIVARG